MDKKSHKKANKTIYIQLLDEGSPTLRPTMGADLGNGLYKVLRTSNYDPEDEKWEFLPGSIVRCDEQQLPTMKGKVLVAVQQIKKMTEDKNEIRAVLAKFIDKEGVDKVMSSDATLDIDLSLKERDIEYVFAMVQGENAQVISSRMGEVSEIAMREGALVFDMISSIVFMCYGCKEYSTPPSGTRSSLVSTVSKALDKDVKIVHGFTRGHYGNLGGPRMMFYGIIIPIFPEILQKLFAIGFGDVCEVQ